MTDPQPVQIPPQHRQDIQSDIDNIEKLIASGIFTTPGTPLRIYIEPSFVSLLVSLRDLMFKAQKYASRISFADDVKIQGKVKDVTGLIKFVRDAACHPEIENHALSRGNRAVFGMVTGKGALFEYDGEMFGGEYEDDVCFLYADNAST